VANISEIFERISYYGAFASSPSTSKKSSTFPRSKPARSPDSLRHGLVLGNFGGAIADRLGFRRALPSLI
jgi:hypothetical protein